MKIYIKTNNPKMYLTPRETYFITSQFWWFGTDYTCEPKDTLPQLNIEVVK